MNNLPVSYNNSVIDYFQREFSDAWDCAGKIR